MRVMFNISSNEAGAMEAEKLKNRIVDLFNEFELTGTVQGDKYPSGASYICNYQKRKKKAAKPKPDPKYDPGQYYKGPWDGKKDDKRDDKKDDKKESITQEQNVD